MSFVANYALAALLSGARTARRSDLAKTLYDRMQSLFSDYRPTLISASILLSNTYQSLGASGEASDVRDNRLKAYGAKVEPGKTWTVVNGQVAVRHSACDRDVVRNECVAIFLKEFKAHDISHPQSSQIYAKMEEILGRIKELGYEADQSWVTRPLQNDETPESVLCGHSERLAIAFNLIQDPSPTVIYITKNLRICPDCRT